MAPTKRSVVARTTRKSTTTSATKSTNTSSGKNRNSQLQDGDLTERRAQVNGTGGTLQDNPLEKEIAAMKAALEKEQRINAELQKRLDTNVAEPSNTQEPKTISRPSGTAGTNFSIQEAMGLSGSVKKYETYKAIQRNLRDLMLNARINWEIPWADVPVRDKARLFEVARDRHPFLSRFERDWATEEIVKQYIKNKRKNHYARGWLEVPEKYAYLKQNSTKRDPAGSRSKKAMEGVLAAGTREARGKRVLGLGSMLQRDELDEEGDESVGGLE